MVVDAEKQEETMSKNESCPTVENTATEAAGSPVDHFHSMNTNARRMLLISALILCVLGAVTQFGTTISSDFLSTSIGTMSSSSSWETKDRNNNNNNNSNSKNMETLSTTSSLSLRHDPLQDLYSPTMIFSLSADEADANNKNGNGTSKAKKRAIELPDCTKAAKELQWEWWKPSSMKEETSTSPQDKKGESGPSPTSRHLRSKGQRKKRVLIGLWSGFDKNAELLAHSAHLAKLYSNHQQHKREEEEGDNVSRLDVDVVVLQGIAFAPKGCTPPVAHASLNKIRLLFVSIDKSVTDDYDYVLLLDADSLLVDWDVDITTLMTMVEDKEKSSSKSSGEKNDFLIAAQPVQTGEDGIVPEPYKVNAAVTLWNLHHPQIRNVALKWFEGAKQSVTKGTYTQGSDERYLQAALRSALEEEEKEENNAQRHSTSVSSMVLGLKHNEFAYAEGTVVQHILQHGSTSWQDKAKKTKAAYTKVCSRMDCSTIPFQEYPTH